MQQAGDEAAEEAWEYSDIKRLFAAGRASTTNISPRVGYVGADERKNNMDKKAKTAAAISAAVINYIRTEEKSFMMDQGVLPAGQSASDGAQAVALPVFNIWGLSGRQAIMQTRNLMQMKAFSRGRQ